MYFLRLLGGKKSGIRVLAAHSSPCKVSRGESLQSLSGRILLGFFHLPVAPGILALSRRTPLSAPSSHGLLICSAIFLPLSLSSLTRAHPGFPGGVSGKEPTCQCRSHKRCGFDPLGLEDPLEEGMAVCTLQCSHLKNLMDRGAWWATTHSVAKRVRHN